MATDCLARDSMEGEQPSAAGALLGGGSCRKPPVSPRAASGFSGRRFCRIYPEGGVWMLQLDPGPWGLSREDRQTFATLNAAIAYAIRRGYSYRVVHSSEMEERGKPIQRSGAVFDWTENRPLRDSTRCS
jgi:hypothetical protein